MIPRAATAYITPMDDDAPDVLRLAILQIMAEAGRPLSAEEVAEELARRALETLTVLHDPHRRGH